MNNKDTHNCDFADLSQDQLTAVKKFENEFNEKYNSQIYIMAFDQK